MTCREFKQNAETLTLWELLRTHDQLLLQHAQECDGCGGWLREQRALAASLHALQARTATLEAAPKVEHALRQAFRQKWAQAAAAQPISAAVLPKCEAGETESDAVAPTPAITAAAPFALRASRWFEVGAYVAVAAAIVVALLLGVRLLPHTAKPAPVESLSSPPLSKPEAPKQPAVTEPQSAAVSREVTSKRQLAAADKPAHSSGRSITEISMPAQQSAMPDSQADNTGYVPLMFCDPLSCAADAQIVRMELPPNPASQTSQPQLADVVVGYDGVVRAVRMVN